MIGYYETLEVDPKASKQDIKKAYFNKVRQFPPELYPDEFIKIRKAYEVLGNEKLRESYDKLLELDETERSLYDLARMAMKDGDFKEAIELLEKLDQFFPEHAIILEGLASSYEANENPLKAAEIYSRLLKTDPENPIYLAGLADCYFSRKWYRKAIRYYEKALRIDDENLDNWVRLMSSLSQTKHEKKKLDSVIVQALEICLKSYDDAEDLFYTIILVALKYFEEKESLGFVQKYMDMIEDLCRKKPVLRQAAVSAYDHLAGQMRTFKQLNMHLKLKEEIARLIPEDESAKKGIEEAQLLIQRWDLTDKLAKDPGFALEWAALFWAVLEKGDDGDEMSQLINEIEILICELEILSEPQKFQPQLPRLRKKYPELYGIHSEFLNALNNPILCIDMFKTRFHRYQELSDEYPELFLLLNDDHFLGDDSEDDEFDEDMDDEEWPEPVVRDPEKVGRNDPCPCGSGKKYKKCCGRNR